MRIQTKFFWPGLVLVGFIFRLQPWLKLSLFLLGLNSLFVRVWESKHLQASVNPYVKYASLLEDLVEEIISGMHLPEIHPAGMANQIERQQNSPRKILYVTTEEDSRWPQRVLLSRASPLIWIHGAVFPDPFPSQLQSVILLLQVQSLGALHSVPGLVS